MTAVAYLHHSDMDLLHTDDQMDLASSPAMPAVDIDFDLDDVREVSVEPNQDLMLQDEPEEALRNSDPMRSATSDPVDDDLMLDEDTITQQDNQPNLPELTMDNHGDDPTPFDDDDILYEDEEDLQQQESHPEGSVKEQEMEDGVDAERLQAIEKARVTEHFEEEIQIETDIDIQPEQGPQPAREAHSDLEQPQNADVELPVNAFTDTNTSTEPDSNAVVEKEASPKCLANSSSDDAHHQDAIHEHVHADIEHGLKRDLEHDINDIDVNSSILNHSVASNALSQLGALEFSAQPLPKADVDPFHEQSLEESAPHPSLLHTVKVHYLETEMCLFPPTEDDDTEMFFLQDMSLAHESLDKILGACRDVLANTIGQDDELVLDVASLGLHISEGSRYATQLTLSQIIDVYVALSHNENMANLEPLHCSLSSRVCLASQYAYLQSAANEGKTLTQIHEENTFALEDNGESGEDAPEYEQAEVHDQEESAVSKDMAGTGGENGESGISSTLDPEQIHEATNAKTNSPAAGSDHNPDDGPPYRDEDGSYETKDGDLKETEPQLEEHSATSTIKGDSKELEDHTVSVSDTHDNDGPVEDFSEGVIQHVEHSSLDGSANATDPNDVSKPDAESNVQGSVSSRTVEAENNQPDEDLFSQHDQSFEDDMANFAENQHDDVEDFDLEEHSYEDAGFEFDNIDSAQPDDGTEHHDLEAERAAPKTTIDLIGDSGVSDRTHKDNQDRDYVDDNEELLNFDDDEEGDGKKKVNQETFLSTQPDEISGDEGIQEEAVQDGIIEAHGTTENQNGNIGHLENDSSSKALDPRGSQSPGQQSTNNTSTEPAVDAPSTPSSGKNAFKRKALDDDDEFDLFDTVSPDKKRRRPS